MKLIKIIETLLFILGLGLLFVDWKIGVGVLLLAGVVHTIPHGPDRLLNVMAGSSLLGAVVALFYDWRLSIGLVILGFLTTSFRIYGNRINHEYYEKQRGMEVESFKKQDSAQDRIARMQSFDVSKNLLKWMHDNGQFGYKPFPTDEELHKIWDDTQELKIRMQSEPNLQKKSTIQKLDEQFSSPEFAVTMIDHLVNIGQIKDDKWSTWTPERKLNWAKQEIKRKDASLSEKIR